MGFIPRANSVWSYDNNCWSLLLCRSPKPKGTCQVLYCRTTAFCRLRRKGLVFNAICNRCQARRWRANNPERAAWNCLKDRARRRGQHFDLSWEQLRDFLRQTPDYNTRRGTSPRSYHIDRRDPALGYTLSNLQILTAHNNIKKRNQDIEQSYL